MLNRRSAIIATLALGALAAAAALGSDQEPGPASEQTPSSTTAETRPRGDPPEPNDGPIAVPQAGRLARAPVATARRFVEGWLQRSSEVAVLRRQRRLLVGLATGDFAQLVQVTIDDAIATGDVGAETEGQVVDAKRLASERGADASVLIVVRERQLSGAEPLEPYRYAIYLAQLQQTAAGGYALSALEPQS